MAFLDDVKAMIGENLGDDYDSLLGVIIAGVQDSADEYMGLKHFDTVTDEVVYFDGGAIFSLPHANVSSVSVSVRETVIASDYYSVNGPRGIVRMIGRELPMLKDSVAITYSGG